MSQNKSEHNPDNNDDPKLSDELHNLKTRIKSFEQTTSDKQESQPRSQDASNMAVAFRACSELIISIGVCGVIGYGLDQAINTSPLCMIIGLLVGMCVGFLGVYRITNNMGLSVGYMHLHDANKNDTQKSKKTENNGSTST